MVSMGLMLGRCWLWLRRRRMREGGGVCTINVSGGTHSSPAVKVLRVSGLRRGLVLIGVGGARVVPARERTAARTWHVTSPPGGVGAAALNRTEMPNRLTPADFGLTRGAVLAEADGVKHFFGPADDLVDAVRR